jgi:CRP/FNR family cyclic AMP-dependent transcriptional regulator
VVTSKKEIRENLSRVPLFSELSNKQLDQLLGNSKEVTHTAGDVVVTEGSEGAGFHLILAGTAKVVRNGRKVAALGPGDHFGEMALIDGGRRSATVAADSDLVTLYVSQWDFKPLVQENPKLAWKIVVHLTKRLREEQKGRDALLG